MLLNLKIIPQKPRIICNKGLCRNIRELRCGTKISTDLDRCQYCYHTRQYHYTDAACYNFCKKCGYRGFVEKG